jgi:Uma2 family endonuclease
MHLLTHLIRRVMGEQGRTDFFTGGNMFVYYSVEQAREVAEEEAKGLPERAFRGPDVFWVQGVPDPKRRRKCWIAWEEGGRLPDVIVELLSPSTQHKDRKEKKDLYSQVFHTAEYFLYDFDTREIEGWRLVDHSYRPIPPDEKGRLWSGQLGAFLGVWPGDYEGVEQGWVRLFRPDGTLLPTKDEAAEQKAEAERRRAEAEHQRAEAERQRAEAAEAEVARLRAALEGRRQD